MSIIGECYIIIIGGPLVLKRCARNWKFGFDRYLRKITICFLLQMMLLPQDLKNIFPWILAQLNYDKLRLLTILID